MFIGRTDAEAETPILWSADATNSLEKTLMVGKIEGRRRREGQRMRWLDGHHQLNGHEFMQTPRDREGQGILLQSMGSQRFGYNLVTEQQ